MEDIYQVQNFALKHDLVQTIHNFLDARVVVPHVDIQNINVIRAEVLQRRLEGEPE
jgi:hypothetical protein